MLNGYVHPDFAEVAASLSAQLPKNHPGGTAVAVYHRGEKVVDVWGGIKDPAGTPWAEDTIAPSFSTTKGVVSTLVHVLAERGALAYDAPIAEFWPEFGSRGKDVITVRQALCHQAGLYRISELINDPGDMLNWELMKRHIADAEPVHTPGEYSGYHALTYGWLMGGLIEAVTGQSVAASLDELLVQPLELDGMFIGLPEEALSRRAILVEGEIKTPRERQGWQGDLLSLMRGGLSRVGVDLDEFKAALNPFEETFDWNAEETVQACIPAANGQFTARSLARMYAMIAEGGELDGVRLLSDARVEALRVVQHRRRDRVLFIPMHWRLGYHRAFTVGARAPDAFGHYGYGGSGAFCDPTRRLSVAVTVNAGSGTPAGDARVPRIARAAMRSADRLS